MRRAGANHPFPFTLPPEDVARLAVDPEERVRWVESVTHGMLPPLRELVPILQTKVRLSAGRALVCVCSVCTRAEVMRARRSAVAPPGLHEARSAGQDVARPRPWLGGASRWNNYARFQPGCYPRCAVGGGGRALGRGRSHAAAADRAMLGWSDEHSPPVDDAERASEGTRAVRTLPPPISIARSVSQTLKAFGREFNNMSLKPACNKFAT